MKTFHLLNQRAIVLLLPLLFLPLFQNLMNGQNACTDWDFLANQGSTFTITGSNPKLVRYGANGVYFYRFITGSQSCNAQTFGGEPQVNGARKKCFVCQDAQIGANVALNRPTRQSSKFFAPMSAAGESRYAVDGNTNGKLYNNSVSKTNFQTNPWWEVDLGRIVDIGSIGIWNRTDDCCIGELGNFYIMASKEPISENSTTKNLYVEGPQYLSNTSFARFENATQARYIRIFIRGNGKSLALAEVEVIEQANLAYKKTTRQSSTYNANTGFARNAVDGNTSGKYGNQSVTHTKRENNPWWEVDLGDIYDIQRIEIWNRTDCCSERLDGFYIMASEDPITSNNTELDLLVGGPQSLGLFKYKEFKVGEQVQCSNTTFGGDPVKMVRKKCFISQEPPAQAWKSVADEGDQFHVPGTNDYKNLVRFGTFTPIWGKADWDDGYLEKELKPGRDFTCNAQTFGGSDPGSGAKCYYKEANSESWKLAANKGQNINVPSQEMRYIRYGARGQTAFKSFKPWSGAKRARYVRLFIPGNSKILSLAEVKVFGKKPVSSNVSNRYKITVTKLVCHQTGDIGSDDVFLKVKTTDEKRYPESGYHHMNEGTSTATWNINLNYVTEKYNVMSIDIADDDRKIGSLSIIADATKPTSKTFQHPRRRRGWKYTIHYKVDATNDPPTISNFNMILASDSQYPRALNEFGTEDSGLKLKSRENNQYHARTMNDLIKDSDEPVKGMIMNGDITEFGRFNHLDVMQDVYFDGSLKTDTYPGLGNHDYQNNLNDCGWPDSDDCAEGMVRFMVKYIRDNKNRLTSYDWNFNNKSGSMAYSWDIGNVHFIQLHNYMSYEITDPDKKINEFTITNSQDWLERDLAAARAAGKYIIINQHDPKQDISGFVSRYKVSAIFVGHLHPKIGREGLIGNAPLYYCGSSIFHKFLWVEFRGDKMKVYKISSDKNDADRGKKLQAETITLKGGR